MQETLSASLDLSNFWSKDCVLLVRLLPLRSRPPLPVYRNHSPLSSSSSYLSLVERAGQCAAVSGRNARAHPPDSATDCAPWLDWPAMPATCGKCAPHWRHSSRSAHASPTSTPRLREGSADAGMGPKWSCGTVTKMRPLDAFALPARTARSVTKASSGRASLAILAAAAAADGCRSPRLAWQ